MRNISENGVKFTAAWEDFNAVSYRATKAEKHLTIGFGHYGPDVKAGQNITVDAAYALLREDMAKVVRAVDAVAHKSLTQAQFDAVCDMCFNVGIGCINAVTGTGTFLRAGNIEGLRAKMSLFINQGGKPMLGLKRRVVGRLALFDGNHWREAERKGRMQMHL